MPRLPVFPPDSPDSTYSAELELMIVQSRRQRALSFAQFTPTQYTSPRRTRRQRQQDLARALNAIRAASPERLLSAIARSGGRLAPMATLIPSRQSNGANAGPDEPTWRRPPQSQFHNNSHSHNHQQQQQHPYPSNIQLPSYSKQFERLYGHHDSSAFSPYAARSHEDSFFTPSYLRSSRYVAQLYAAHKARLSAQRDAQSQSQSQSQSQQQAPGTAAVPSTPHHPGPPSASSLSLSASPGQINPHRIAPSHRGMTYDIVENQVSGAEPATPSVVPALTPLPSRWNENDKYVGLDILSDGLEVRYIGQTNKHEQEAAAVRADQPMPVKCGIYYFEVTILSKPKDGMIGVGFSNSKASLERLPGWEADSWAYHGDDGKTFFGDNQGQGMPYGPTFTVNDTIGCGVVFSTGSAFFTKNGSFLGNAFRDLKPAKLFPSVGVRKQPGAHVRANFGQFPFIFNIDSLMAREKYEVQKGVGATDLSNVHPALNETEFMQKLVAQFLAHDGYVETAKIFAKEVGEENIALHNADDSSLTDFEVEDDADAINRQKIRAAILSGDIDRALKLTNAHYANVLTDNPHINFRLRCRKFIEMMRRCTEPQRLTPSHSMNGLFSDPNHPTTSDVFTLDMEVDDRLPDFDSHVDFEHEHGTETETDEAATPDDMMETDGIHDASNSNNGTAKNQELLHDAILYGQQLQADYPGTENKEHRKTLDDIFSLVAYADPKSSVHGHLLDKSGRAVVAEELNSAILGKSSSATLERLYQQTEALIDELTEDGGEAALINVVDDYLR